MPYTEASKRRHFASCSSQGSRLHCPWTETELAGGARRARGCLRVLRAHACVHVQSKVTVSVEVKVEAQTKYSKATLLLRNEQLGLNTNTI